jgi:hypothetical protein
MAEITIWATTGGSGPAAYDQTKVTDFFYRLLGDGVCKDHEGELAVSAGTGTSVNVATGACQVHGFGYKNTATVNKPLNIPVSHPRIDTIVVRNTYSTETTTPVVITVIEGEEAASPVAPDIVQDVGITWDVKLAEARVETNGTVTVTDARTFIVSYADVPNDSVDDTKVGQRVPQFYRRQGGHATNWNMGGDTNYTPGMVRMQAGSFALTIPYGMGEATVGEIWFPVAFSGNPLVLVTLEHINRFSLGSGWCDSLTVGFVTTERFGVQIKMNSVDAEHTIAIHWLAIGPE